ncbi:MAG: hypothetical protein O7J95_20645 [Planctomycetota bacterium]|nr:hypothetical protein [Planctomycetota bacterium]
MQYRLEKIPVETPAPTATLSRSVDGRGEELLDTLSRRRASSEDRRLTAGELRVHHVSPEGVTLAWESSGGPRPVGGELLDVLRRWTGWGRREFMHRLYESPGSTRRRFERAVEERGESWGGFFVRLLEGRVRALLPGDYRPVDHLEAASAFRDECVRWRQRGVDVRLASCEESHGDLFLAACAPSLAAEVTEGDWLYAGLALANSECSPEPLEVRPRIYRAVCANGAIAQEAEAEGFEIRKSEFPHPTPAVCLAEPRSFRERLAHSFELAFRPERVEREAAIDRAASRATLVNPFEHVQHLVARDLLSEDERDLVQRLFEEESDSSLYGLANAVTAAAHTRLRARPRRASALEQLGGAIARGDVGPPVGAPVWV